MPQDAHSGRQRDLDGEDRRLGDLGLAETRVLLPAAPARRAATSRSPAANRASTRAIARRNTGSRATSSRPMPHHCGPWPEKTKTGAGRSGGAGARHRPGRLAAGKAVRGRPSRSGTRSPATASRSSKCRPAAAPPSRTRHGRTSGIVTVAAPATSGASGAARRAAAGFAAGRQRQHERPGRRPGGAVFGLRQRAAASSRSTCAFVPPNPNELTPAKRGRAPRGQGAPLASDTQAACRRARRAGSGA